MKTATITYTVDRTLPSPQGYGDYSAVRAKGLQLNG